MSRKSSFGYLGENEMFYLVLVLIVIIGTSVLLTSNKNQRHGSWTGSIGSWTP